MEKTDNLYGLSIPISIVGSSADPENQRAETALIGEDLRTIRRHLHSNPELSGKETETTAYVGRYLSKHGIPYELGPEGVGIVSNLAREVTGCTRLIALRADLDALPIQEEIDTDYRSQQNGVSCLGLEEMPPPRKGVIASRSFGSHVEELEDLEEALASHVARASEKIRRFGLLATHIEIFLQTNRFRKEDPQYYPSIGVTLPTPTASTSELMATARELLRSIYRTGYRYKKTGVMLAHLVSEEEYQPSLFHAPVNGKIDIDKIVDEINRRMGDNRSPVITRASMGTANRGDSWRMKAERHSPNYTTDWDELPVVRG